MTNIGYAFIGTPKGLQTKNGGIIEGADIRRYIDLDNSIIKVNPNTELFSIRKVVSNEDVFYFITQYEYAKEIESQRTGTFFGSTLVLKNTIASAEAILLVLSELMASFREYISPDNRFLTTLDQLPLKASKRLLGLQNTLKKISINPKAISDQELLIHLSGENDFRARTNFIHQCLHDKAFESFQTVYASEDPALLHFVKANKTMRTASISVSYETTIEKLERHCKVLRQEIEQEHTKLTTLQEQKKQLIGQIEKMEQQQNTLTSKYGQTEKTITSNLSKLQAYEKELRSNLKNLKQQQTVAEESYQSTINDYEAQKTQIDQQLVALKTSQETFDKTCGELKLEIEILQQKKETLHENNQKLMDDFELIGHNVKQIDEQNQEVIAEKEQLLKEKSVLEVALRQLKNDYDSLSVLLEKMKVKELAVQAREAKKETAVRQKLKTAELFLAE